MEGKPVQAGTKRKAIVADQGASSAPANTLAGITESGVTHHENEGARKTADSPVIGQLQPNEEAAWDAYVSTHPEGTIYHTLSWRAVMQRALGHKPYYLRTRNESGGISGIFPIFLIHGIFGKHLVSVPLRDRGGPLCDHPQAGRLLIERALEIKKETGAQTLMIKFPAAHCGAWLKELGAVEQRHWVTTSVPLEQGPEGIWNDVLRSPTRRAVKKAASSGLQVSWSQQESDLKDFYRLFLMTRRQLGIPPYTWKFFQAMYGGLVPRGLQRLLLVKKDGRSVAGLIVFLSGKEVISAYMGYDVNITEMRPNDILFWEAIRWSAEAGYRSFYFGADSPHQTGLLAFKQKWGGVTKVISNYLFSDPGRPLPVMDGNDPRFSLHRRIVSHLPIPVLRLAGSWLTKQMA